MQSVMKNKTSEVEREVTGEERGWTLVNALKAKQSEGIEGTYSETFLKMRDP